MKRRRIATLSTATAVVVAAAVLVVTGALSGHNRGGGPGFDQPLSAKAAGGQARPGPGHTATPAPRSPLASGSGRNRLYRISARRGRR